jgi:hypothetical protein
MATFDFIASEEERRSLERDAEELVACMKAGAWKAVHLLAGGIIQAALVDYLGSDGSAERSRLLQMNLHELLGLCRERQILSARTIDLSTYLQPYLDLIHPDLTVRSGQLVDENGARIAQALVELILNEVAGHKRGDHGYTADQIVAKLHADPSSISIILHILRRTTQYELERLLIEGIPRAYLDLERLPEAETGPTLKNLEACFRLAFDMASEDVRRRVARRYLSVLEEESEHTVRLYESRFFRGADLRFLEEKEREIVKTHFFASLARVVNEALLNAAEGFGAFLNSEHDARAFFVPLLMAMLDSPDRKFRAMAGKRFREEFQRAAEDIQRPIRRWVGRVRVSLERESQSGGVEAIEGLEASI